MKKHLVLPEHPTRLITAGPAGAPEFFELRPAQLGGLALPPSLNRRSLLVGDVLLALEFARYRADFLLMLG
jgi:hypothetical protein